VNAPAPASAVTDLTVCEIPEQAADDFDSAVQDSRTEQEIASSPGVFRSIGEAASELQLPAHVLRYWETQFEALQPLKRSGGRRYYRPADIAFLKLLRGLLHEQGYTIRGVQRLLSTNTGGETNFELDGSPESVITSLGDDLSPLALQAVVAKAAEAGSFNPSPSTMISGAAASNRESGADRLRSALNEMLTAKSLLDAVRKSA
jgi:DNA-binding transcriptional MerR regulator